MKKSIIITFIILIVASPLSSLAITFTPQEISGIIKITSYLAKESIYAETRSLRGIFTDEEIVDYRKELEAQKQTGTGFMITYSGCVLTNKHVIYDLEVLAAYQDIHLWQTNNVTEEPEDLGKASIIYMRTLDDIAIVCLDNAQGKFFNRSFIKTDDYDNLTLELGEEIYTMGYPASGDEYLTLTSGIVSGIWDEDTIKTDMAITDGASGSPIFNSQKQIVGIAQGNTGYFDQLGLFLKPSFVIDWLEGYKNVYRSKLAEDTAGCMDTDTRGIYQKEGPVSPGASIIESGQASQGGLEYYDLSCKTKRNYGLESKLAYEYKINCQTDISEENIIEASSYIASGKSTINHWVAYAESLCLPVSSVTVFDASAK